MCAVRSTIAHTIPFLMKEDISEQGWILKDNKVSANKINSVANEVRGK